MKRVSLSSSQRCHRNFSQIMPLHIATHPLIAHKMTILRDTKTDPQEFRKVMKEITFYLGYEATRSIKTVDVDIDTPLMATTGKKIAENVALIPILRAGLGMCDAMLELLPKAAVHHIGKFRMPCLRGSNIACG